MKSRRDFDKELIIKEERIAYWGRFHRIPRMSDLISNDFGNVVI